MAIKTAYASIQNGLLQVPPEALELLPQSIPLHFFIDTEKGTVTIYAKDPTDLPNKEVWAEFTDLVADVDWRTYTEPVPEHLLRRPRKDGDAE
ncbi:hypothetical protein V8J88_13280 [Massilia sp. W12]|uniref:hypothetical protein n=1 Tax=Massilia sp. W12 TaxID=3126507 RepID=UPI0030CADCF8